MILATRSWGDPQARPVVCLHGLTGHGGRFRRLAQERLASYHVVGVDYRGHGRSGWEPPWSVEQHLRDLLETTDALGIPRAAWIGHSFGGALVAELAAHHPERVERAVLLDPALHVAPQVAGERAELARADVSFESPEAAVETRLADGTLFTTSRETLQEEAREHLALGPDGRYRWRYAPAAAVVAWSEMASPAPAFPRCPTLVVLGARSWIPVEVPAAEHVRAVTVPGGHSVLWDDFDATADAVEAFLAPS